MCANIQLVLDLSGIIHCIILVIYLNVCSNKQVQFLVKDRLFYLLKLIRPLLKEGPTNNGESGKHSLSTFSSLTSLQEPSPPVR